MTTTTKPAETSRENALESAVARALRDNLIPLQRTVEDLQTAYSDLISACSSSRPTNALPSMVRAQTAAASLSAALAVLSNFVTITLHSRQRGAQAGQAASLCILPGSSGAAARSRQQAGGMDQRRSGYNCFSEHHRGRAARSAGLKHSGGWRAPGRRCRRLRRFEPDARAARASPARQSRRQSGDAGY